jgi:hypothetical protein
MHFDGVAKTSMELCPMPNLSYERTHLGRFVATRVCCATSSNSNIKVYADPSPTLCAYDVDVFLTLHLDPCGSTDHLSQTTERYASLLRKTGPTQLLADMVDVQLPWSADRFEVHPTLCNYPQEYPRYLVQTLLCPPGSPISIEQVKHLLP